LHTINIDLSRVPTMVFFDLPLSNQGKPGCRNVRLGGDTATPPSEASKRWYATYVVYRSFKYPPPVPKLEEH